MFTRKQKKQMRDRAGEINARFVEIAALIESEKRSMTSDEVAEKDALKIEKDAIELRLLQSERGILTNEQISNDRAFDMMIGAIVHGRALDEESLSSLLVTNGKLGGMAIPATRALQDTASVEPIVPLTIGDIIEPLEKGLIMSRLGLKVQHGMTGAWQFPVVAGVEASMEGENVEISDSNIDISKISPSPKRVAIAIPISNRAINQSNGVIRQIVLTQISMSVARLLNKWMFSDTKIAAIASDGCFVNPATKNNGALTWTTVVALECDVMATGVKMEDGTGAYVCNAKTYAKLKTTPKDKGSGLMLLGADGLMNGYPVYVTEYAKEDTLNFGIFSYEMLGQFGDANLIYDPYTGATRNLVYFVYNADYDLLTLRNQAFGTLTIDA